MKIIKTFLLLIFVFIGSNSIASDCFFVTGVTSFESNGRNSVIVHAMKYKYQVDTHICFDLEWADAIAFESWTGSPRICKGDDLLVSLPFTGRHLQRCKILNITKLQN